MWTHVDRGSRKPDCFVDVINGWPLTTILMCFKQVINRGDMLNLGLGSYAV